jgi:CheY-like chemotaxis protein
MLHTQPKTVLIVEDNRDIRESLAMLLEVVGYRTETASEGREALNYLRSHPLPSLILLDLRMPGMGGLQFRAEQRQDPALAAVPVIVCSGEWFASLPEPLQGIAAFCAKPTDPERLLQLVATHCA